MTTPSLADPHAASPLAPHEPDRVARVRLGDQAAFEAMFTEHYRSLCDFVMSMVRVAQIAEEIVQSVFMRIWERRATWDPSGGVRGYLFTACRHHALDHLKHERTVASFARRSAQE